MLSPDVSDHGPRRRAGRIRAAGRHGDDEDVTLGFLEGIQMTSNGNFTNGTAAYDGDMVAQSATSACVVQYNSDFNSTII